MSRLRLRSSALLSTDYPHHGLGYGYGPSLGYGYGYGMGGLGYPFYDVSLVPWVFDELLMEKKIE